MRLSSRERLLAALQGGKTDHLPCSFMLFTGLRKHCRDQFEFVQRQLDMGLDARVDIPDIPIRFHPEVSWSEWIERPAAGPLPVICKEYRTPAGTLRAEVFQTEDWPYGDHLPLFDDYIAPRSRKFLVTGPKDLPALAHLLAEPDADSVREFRERAEAAHRFARSRDLLLCGGGCNFDRPDLHEIGHDAANMGVDALMWLCGAEAPLIWIYEQPEFLEELLSLISRWNRRRLEITLDAGPDLVIKRAWYEGTEFWSPDAYRRYIAPILKKDVELAHQHGAKFGYILTSGTMPVADHILWAGPDALVGIDPVQGKGTDLETVRDRLGGKLCLWGGVNGCITVETGTEQDVREAVDRAIDFLGGTGRFILSPVDNVRMLDPAIEKNVSVFIETWRANR